MRISAEQERRVNELLRRRGERCPQCGECKTLASTGEAYVNAAHRVAVRYACSNRDVQHPEGFGSWSLALEPYERRKIGF
jgi:hypothetical protein